MGVGGQRHAPAALLPGKTRYPLYRRLGGSQSRSGQVRKISPPTGIRSMDHPARSESLYRLSSPGSFYHEVRHENLYKIKIHFSHQRGGGTLVTRFPLHAKSITDEKVCLLEPSVADLSPRRRGFILRSVNVIFFVHPFSPVEAFL
jgi:hypothetical protein